MQLYGALVAVCIWIGTLGAAYLHGLNTGEDRTTAMIAREEKVAAIATDAAASAAANAISKIEVKNVSITQKLEREVLTREVFRDCRSGPDAERLLNSGEAIAPATTGSAPGGGQLPASGAAR